MLLTKNYVFPEGIVGKCFRFQEVAKDWFAASCHVTQNGRLILLQLKFQSCPHYGVLTVGSDLNFVGGIIESLLCS